MKLQVSLQIRDACIIVYLKYTRAWIFLEFVREMELLPSWEYSEVLRSCYLLADDMCLATYGNYAKVFVSVSFFVFEPFSYKLAQHEVKRLNNS